MKIMLSLGTKKATQLLGPSRPVETLMRGDIPAASNQKRGGGFKGECENDYQ
jgi:hypothetical protein